MDTTHDRDSLTGIQFTPEIGPRRPGDPDRIVATGELAARDLDWQNRYADPWHPFAQVGARVADILAADRGKRAGRKRVSSSPPMSVSRRPTNSC